MPDQWARWLRPLWILLFGFSILVVVVSTVYAYRTSYSTQPIFHEFGLDFEVGTDGDLTVGTLARAGQEPVPVDARIVAIDGKRVPNGIVVASVADRLAKARGPTVEITLQRPGVGEVQVGGAVERNLRIWIRLLAGVFACTALLACSFLLALRRPNDPVAMILAFAFAGMVATIDPPLQYWLWNDLDYMTDIIGGVFFYLLVIGLAAFPDGVFVPRLLRWPPTSSYRHSRGLEMALVCPPRSSG
jgi:hypothetical protein